MIHPQTFDDPPMTNRSTTNEEPIYVLGRQHCGNTMLATLLGRIPGCFAMTEEGNYFEYRDEFPRLDVGAARRKLLALIQKAQAPPLEDDQLEASAETAGRRGIWPPRTRGDWDEFYRHIMDDLADRHGASRWVQKATSYIFYVEDVLEVFPQARLLFLVRNPFDLAASTKRRDKLEATARMIWGWTRGVRLAREYRDRYPDQFRIVRYEDLVRQPAHVVESICEFTDLEFEPEYLDVQHVNPSENPYSTNTGRRGIDDSRVGYFRRVLDAPERQAIRLLAPEADMADLYPEMLADEQPPGPEGYRRAAQLVGMSARDLAVEHGRKLWSSPVHTVDRIYRRLFT